MEILFRGDLSIWMGLIIACTASGFCWWLYYRESRQLSNAGRWLLPLLRSAAIFLAIIILAGPVFHQRWKEGEPGHITFILDGSDSMSIIDGESSIEPNSSNTNLQAPSSPSQGRFHRATEELIRPETGMLAQLSNGFEVKVERLDTVGTTLLWESTVAAQDLIPQTVDPWKPDNWGTQTALSDALDSFNLNSTIGSDGKETSGGQTTSTAASDLSSVVVLLSDGQNNTDPSPISNAAQLQEQNVKVYTIGYGADAAPQDLSISRIVHPAKIQAQDTLRGSISFYDYVSPGTPFFIQVSCNNAVVWQQNLQTQNSGQRQIDFSFNVKDTVDNIAASAKNNLKLFAIPLELTAEIVPLDSETVRTNNTQSSRLLVSTRKGKILILDGRSRWETRYIRNALERDPSWDVNTIIFDEHEIGQGVVRGDKDGQFPSSRDKLYDFDLIILGEVQPTELTSEELEWIKSFVEQTGGGLIIIDGQRQHLRADQFSVIHPLFPVKWRNDKSLTGDVSLRLGLTPTGESLPVFQISNTVSNSVSNMADQQEDQIWDQLPEFRNLALTEALPGSEVLATVQYNANAYPAFATRRSGAGRVLYCATDETWRWRYNVADVYHQKFWNQVCRWAMRIPFAIQGDYVCIDAGKAQYEIGETIPIMARLKDGQGQQSQLTTVDAVIRSGEQIVATVELQGDTDRPGFFEGTAASMPPGNYDVSLVAPGFSSQALGPTATFRVNAVENVEMLRLSRNSELLQQLADATNGQYLGETEAGKLVELLQPFSRGRIIQSDTLLWNSYWWFAPIVILLSVEWWLRKRAGLV